MQSHEQRAGVEIPQGVKVDDIMRSLEIGHGYRWTILTRKPLLIAHGQPTIGNMPEILLTGSKPMVVAGGDTVYVERIRNILEMIERQSHRVRFTSEG
ncbi:MAG: hypothetical protein RTV31_02455 [Candidatus Thorarchaeota archaeon]